LEAVLGLSLIAAVLTVSSTTADAPFRRVVGEKAAIAESEVVGDLLVVGGSVDISGVVRGHVYAVDAEVTVRSSAVVLTSLTVVRGTVRVEAGGVLPESIDLTSAKLIGPNGEGLAPGKSISLGGTIVKLASTEASTVSLALMKGVLPFERFAPAPKKTIKDLRAWDPGLGLSAARFVESPKELVLGGAARLSFVSGRAEGAFQRGYRGARGSVLLSGIKVSEADATPLWKELERAFGHAKINLSVKSGLGDGAHWFFRSRGRYVMLWQRGPWIFAVETKLAAPTTSIFQERQFQDQVLHSLGRSLGAQP
jgi:hypothetical protein